MNQTQQPTTPGAAGLFAGFFPLIIIFLIFYFLIIRPQVKQTKRHQKMLAGLKKGDLVLTSGGIYGTIVNIKGNVIELKISENVKVKVNKNAISGVIDGTILE